jgi:transcriptional regulator with XRE-family HTH domain
MKGTAEGDLATALILLRIVRGWNQEDLARASGVTNSSISEYERGKKLPELATLRRLMGAMGYPLAAIDEAAAFIAHIRSRAALFAGGAVPWSEPPAAESPQREEAAARGAVPAALSWEVERAAAEAGRTAARVTRLLFVLLAGGNSERSTAGETPGAP